MKSILIFWLIEYVMGCPKPTIYSIHTAWTDDNHSASEAVLLHLFTITRAVIFLAATAASLEILCQSPLRRRLVCFELASGDLVLEQLVHFCKRPPFELVKGTSNNSYQPRQNPVVASSYFHDSPRARGSTRQQVQPNINHQRTGLLTINTLSAAMHKHGWQS